MALHIDAPVADAPIANDLVGHRAQARDPRAVRSHWLDDWDPEDALLMLKPGASLTTLLVGAGLAGIGGGNFSSSMANIDSFYPQRLNGWALGLNAGGGNIGVAATQLVGLAVLAIAGRNHPRLMLAVYMPLIIVSALCAARYMDNLSSVRNDRRVPRKPSC